MQLRRWPLLGLTVDILSHLWGQTPINNVFVLNESVKKKLPEMLSLLFLDWSQLNPIKTAIARPLTDSLLHMPVPFSDMLIKATRQVSQHKAPRR